MRLWRAVFALGVVSLGCGGSSFTSSVPQDHAPAVQDIAYATDDLAGADTGSSNDSAAPKDSVKTDLGDVTVGDIERLLDAVPESQEIGSEIPDHPPETSSSDLPGSEVVADIVEPSPEVIAKDVASELTVVDAYADPGADVASDTSTDTCGSACPNYPIDWITIPGGTFLMGSNWWYSSLPIHSVNVPTFLMSRNEPQGKQYQECVKAGVCSPPWTDAPTLGCPASGYDQIGSLPVTCIDWRQARTFCQWVGGRLCAEAEWEYAARNGAANDLYPWGNSDPTCDDAAFSDPSTECSTPMSPPCSMPQGNNNWGVCDLSGNAYEWLQDNWHKTYDGAPTDGSAWVDLGGGDGVRVDRGGGYHYGVAGLQAGYRSTGHPEATHSLVLGTRCCRDAP